MPPARALARHSPLRSRGVDAAAPECDRRAGPGGVIAYVAKGSRQLVVSARVLAVETNRPVEAVMAARLKPDGGRSRLFSRRPRVGTDAALHRHAVPRTDVTVLDRRLPLRPREAVAPSPRARSLPELVHSTSRAPAGWRASVAGGAEEPRLARRVRSSKRRRQDAYATPRRRRTRTRSRRLSLRLRERLCSPAPTPRCRSSSVSRVPDAWTDCVMALAFAHGGRRAAS